MVLASRLRKDPAATQLTVSGRMDVITSVWPRTMDAPRSNTLKLSFLNTHQACVPNPLFTEPSPAAFLVHVVFAQKFLGSLRQSPIFLFAREGRFGIYSKHLVLSLRLVLDYGLG